MGWCLTSSDRGPDGNGSGGEGVHEGAPTSMSLECRQRPASKCIPPVTATITASPITLAGSHGDTPVVEVERGHGPVKGGL